jgi:hypothetical protein
MRYMTSTATSSRSPPGAYWLLLAGDVQLRRTDYDFAAAAEAILATGFPQTEALVVRYVIPPPRKRNRCACWPAPSFPEGISVVSKPLIWRLF